MQFHVASYRAGVTILQASSAFTEITGVLTSITLQEISSRQHLRQARIDGRGKQGKAGIQDGLNEIIKERLTVAPLGWISQVPVFERDEGTGKGFWTMDFRKDFDSANPHSGQRGRIGIEVTFNHAEAMPWTLIRPTLAYQAETVIPGSRIDVAAIVIGTDNLKGRGRERRMDSAVGTYERLRTLIPKMKWVLPAPIVVFGLDWADGGMLGDVEYIDMHQTNSGMQVAAEPASGRGSQEERP